MANIHTVFEAVLENGTSGKKIKVGVADKYEYETVRTRLVKLWNTHKDTLIAIAGEGCDPLLEFSLCGNFEKSTDIECANGYFYLGKPRRKLAKSYSFSIVDSGATPEGSGGNTLELPEAVNDDTIQSPAISE